MTFEVIPSIDILDGQVVRIERGDFAAKTVFSSEPLAIAKEWEALGAPRLHIVDLDATLEGVPVHRTAIEQIVGALSIPVQVAGGIRSIEIANAWLECGADRVVVGTKALTEPSFLAEAVEALGPRLVVAPDAKEGEVRVEGWKRGTGEDVIDAVRRLCDAGVERLLVTDIRTDGMLEGPNIALLTEVTDAISVPVIASGGVSSIDDLRALADVAGIEGVVVGKALYVGAIELPDALEAVSA